MATAFDYRDLQATATRLITKFGTACVVTHLAGGQSRGVIVMPSRVSSDGSIPDVGTVEAKQTVGFIDNVRNAVRPGDTVVADGTTFRVRESVEYKPATTNVAYRVVLDT